MSGSQKKKTSRGTAHAATKAELREFSRTSLSVQGILPNWLAGTFVRNSAVPILADDKPIVHEFDGLAMLHGFELEAGKVFYRSRYLQSQDYARVCRGLRPLKGVATPMDASIWQRFKGGLQSLKETKIRNASVNVFRYGRSLVALTETPLPVVFKPTTLETEGPFPFDDDLPKANAWESAHPHYDVGKKEIVNVLIEFGRKSYYVIYRLKEGKLAREVIARISVENPSYMHSFAVTDHYVVLTEFPFRVKPLDLVTSGKPFFQNFTWRPDEGTRFLVVDRRTGALVYEHSFKGFFSFHHANAYENASHQDLLVDLVTFNCFADLADIFPQAEGLPREPIQARNSLVRFHLQLASNELSARTILEGKLEFPRLSDQLDGQKYRFLYLTSEEIPATQGLIKVDMESGATTQWILPLYRALEPVFVPHPNAKQEDDGVILTVVRESQTNRSFLIVLDGTTFQELARAEMPSYIPSSFHGQFFAQSTSEHLPV